MITCVVFAALVVLVQASPVANPVAMQKALPFEVVVPASLDDVWQAMSTKPGLETWLWRDTRDRDQGARARAVPDRARHTHRRHLRLAAAGPTATRVTLVHTGWQSGAEWGAAWAQA